MAVPARGKPVQDRATPPQKNRRVNAMNPAGNPLLWCKWVGYLFWTMSMYFTQLGKPPEIGFFHHLLESTAARHWNRDLLTMSWFFLWLAVLVGMGGLILNSMRLRRKNDHLSIGLIVLMLLIVAAMAITPAGNSISTFLSHL